MSKTFQNIIAIVFTVWALYYALNGEYIRAIWVYLLGNLPINLKE